MKVGRKPVPIAERFAQRVAIDAATGCHVWTGGALPNGYGMVWLNGRNHGAHRVAYELSGGTIQDGQVIDHLCHNKLCVNPAHLRATDTRGNACNLKGKSDGKFSSKIPGVSWNKAAAKWRAHAWLNDRLKYLGSFDSESEAGAAYSEAIEFVGQIQKQHAAQYATPDTKGAAEGVGV